MKNCKPILLVEDDDVDAMTVRRAFKELKVTNQLIRSVNGEEALKYLKDQSNEAPCVILLDLNMPKMNGIEFLDFVKSDETLKYIPAIVLTTSNEECDISGSFKHSAAGYIVKPVEYKKFVEAIMTINLYWTLSELPARETGVTNAKYETSSIS
ncbi:MAG: response regulator [Sedimentisphaerales bacterium]|nr:response regulator [Sedimentisphaerales bacterium]